MLFYARSDTHFLLFVYDNLRNLLIQHSNGPESVRQVLGASSRTALQVYAKELYDVEHGLGPFGWKVFLSKFGAYGQIPGEETDRRKAIVVAMHIWRDRVAREMDESTASVLLPFSLALPGIHVTWYSCHLIFCAARRYILPSKLIFRLANAPILPKDVESFLRIVPLTVIRDRASELFDVITNAKLPASLLARRALAQTTVPVSQDATATGLAPTLVTAQASSASGRSDALLPNLWGASLPTRTPPSASSAVEILIIVETSLSISLVLHLCRSYIIALWVRLGGEDEFNRVIHSSKSYIRVSHLLYELVVRPWIIQASS